MRTIRGRILLSFLILAVLTAPILTFSFKSIKKVNDAKDLREKVAIFNVNRLKAFNAFSNIKDYDFKKDSFYYEKETANTKKFHKNIQEGKLGLKEIKSRLQSDREKVKERLTDLSESMDSIENNITLVLSLQQTRGFDDFGMEGKMRKNIHRLETDVEEISLAEILSLRRREKDFFLRGDLKYVDLLNEEYHIITSRIKQKAGPNSATIQILDDYQKMFNQIVQLEASIGNEEKGLLFEIARLNNDMDSETSILYDIVSEDYQLLLNSITSYLFLFLALTTVFIIIFAFVFSNHIAKPLNQLIDDMAKLAKDGFKGKKQLKSDHNIVEIEQLTQSCNEVVFKIRRQIEKLSKTNFELNEVNFKLIESENELKEAAKLKDKFFSIISHDLRGHTGNVLSLAQILNQDLTISDKEKSVFTKYLIDSSQNLQLLLDNLLNWAKSQMNDHEMSKRSFAISNLITKNIGLYQENAMRKGIKINYEQSLNAKAYADKDMIDFVIRNLLSNALKFTTTGDSITFSISEKDNYLAIHIKDTGVGMTPEQIQKLKNDEDDSFTTEGTDNEKGTGLGFSICKDFVSRNGGKISIESEKGKGSEFTFTVPTSLTREVILNIP